MRIAHGLLLACIALAGCDRGGGGAAAYKADAKELFDALLKVRDDIKDGKPDANFAGDLERAVALLEADRRSLSAADLERPSFVNLEAAVEGYTSFDSVSANPELARKVAISASADLKKARADLDAGN